MTRLYITSTWGENDLGLNLKLIKDDEDARLLFTWLASPTF